MFHNKRVFALLAAAAFLIAALVPGAALAETQPAEVKFTATVNLPENLEGQSDITVLGGTMVELVASYGGKLEPPAGTQFCWQYSTTGAADSFNYLTTSITDNSHIAANGIDIAVSTGTTWYRVILDDPNHLPAAGVTPDVSTVVAVRGVDFLFTEPTETPKTVSVAPGEAAVLGPVKAENTKGAAVSYQWQQSVDDSWTDIENATADTFPTPDLEAGSYQYRCLASAALGGADSEPSQIISPVYTVEAKPLSISGYALSLDGTPADMPAGNVLSVDAGVTASFTVELSDSSAPGVCQWQYSAASGGWFDLSAANGVWGCRSETLSVPVTAATSGNRYRCVVTAGDSVLGNQPADPWITLNTVDPAAAYSGITPSPFIYSSLADPGTTEVMAAVGRPVSFTVVNRSTQEIPAEYLSFQWESAASASGAFLPVAGATEAVFTTEAESGEAVFYRCRVTNRASGDVLTEVSNTLQLRTARPNGAVYFTEPLTTPVEAELRPGDEYTFAVHARTDDGSAVEYQWQYARVGSAATAVESVPDSAWTNIADAVKPVYTATDLSAGYFYYRCLAFNRENVQRQAASLAWKVSVLAYSTKPEVEPAQMTTGLGGLPTPRYILVGRAVGGELTMQVEASVPSGDRLDYTWYMVPGTPGADGELLKDQHTDTLVLSDIPLSYNGNSFYCIVSNRSHRGQQTRSGAWVLTVWAADAEPEILAQPHGAVVSYDPSEPDQAVRISVTAENSTAAVLEQLVDEEWTVSEAAELKKDGTTAEGSTSQTYSGTIPLSTASYQLNGTYRVRVVNGTAQAPALAPYAASEMFAIFVSVQGQPVVEADPEPVSAAVGEKAEFTAVFAVEPAAAPLTCCWQISTDGGGTFRNCLEADGTAEGSTFTTAVLTEEMRRAEHPPLYRCLAANAATGQSVLSAAAELTVTPGEPAPPPVIGDPEITVAAGSDLLIEDGYIRGLKASSRGVTAASFLSQLEASAGYHLELVSADGDSVGDNAMIATGMMVQLVRDSDSDEIPVTLTVIVQGDVAGTGRISIVQLTRMAAAVNGQKPLDGAYLMAGDFNDSGTIDVSDLVTEAKLLNQAE